MRSDKCTKLRQVIQDMISEGNDVIDELTTLLEGWKHAALARADATKENFSPIIRLRGAIAHAERIVKETGD